VDILSRALQSAVRQVASHATAQLRSNAVQDGWDASTVSGLEVAVVGQEAKVIVNDDFAAKAFDHEFGNQNHRPKATIRKASSDSQFDNQLAILLDRELGKMK